MTDEFPPVPHAARVRRSQFQDGLLGEHNREKVCTKHRC